MSYPFCPWTPPFWHHWNFFHHLFQQSKRTSIHNLESVAQKMSEFWPLVRKRTDISNRRRRGAKRRSSFCLREYTVLTFCSKFKVWTITLFDSKLKEVLYHYSVILTYLLFSSSSIIFGKTPPSLHIIRYHLFADPSLPCVWMMSFLNGPLVLRYTYLVLRMGCIYLQQPLNLPCMYKT